MRKLLLFMLSFVLTFTVMAQERNYWSSNTDASSIITDKSVARLSFPKDFKLFNLNVDLLRQDLFSVVGNNASRHSTVISLPDAEGQIEQFEVFEASNFEPALQDQFPADQGIFWKRYYRQVCYPETEHFSSRYSNYGFQGR
ncbi:MAG: hypothetical protein V9F01_06025 [Chitinophagaceae bacterium]